MNNKAILVIAAALNRSRPLNSETRAVRQQWNLSVRNIAEEVVQIAPKRFSVQKFYQQCGGLYY